MLAFEGEQIANGPARIGPVEVLANMQLSPPANRTARWTWRSGGARTSDQKTSESLDVWRDWPVAR